MKLIRYEQARTALAEAHRVDEVKDIRDKAQALAAYAKQAKDTEMIAWATEIKVRAERRCGEMLMAAKEQGTRHDGHGDQKTGSQSATPKLDDLGINKSQSSRWQKLAAIPEEKFEASIAIAKELVGEITTASLLNAAKPKPQELTQDEIEKLPIVMPPDRPITEKQREKRQWFDMMHAIQTLAGTREFHDPPPDPVTVQAKIPDYMHYRITSSLDKALTYLQVLKRHWRIYEVT